MANSARHDPEREGPDALRRAKKETEESASLLHAALDATADGILVVDRSGRIVTFNRRFVQMWRLPEALAEAGHSSRTLAFVLDQLKDPGGFVKKTMELYARPEAEGLDIVEFKDGRVFERFSRSQRNGSEIIGRVSSFRDATERRLADEEIERTLSLLRATLDATADGLLVVDTSGRIVTYNRRFVDMWQLPEEVVASRDVRQTLTFVLSQLKNPDRFLKKVNEIYGAPESQSYDWLEFKDGRVFERYSCPQRLGEQTVGRVWSFRDVTDRHRAEEILQRQARAFEHITDAVILLDLEGRVLASNPGAERMFGYEKPELLGAPLPVFADSSTSDPLVPILLESVRKGGRWSGEVPFRRKDGARGICDLLAVRLWDQYGRTVSAMVVARDISERRRLEDELRALRAQRTSLTLENPP